MRFNVTVTPELASALLELHEQGMLADLGIIQVQEDDTASAETDTNPEGENARNSTDADSGWQSCKPEENRIAESTVASKAIDNPEGVETLTATNGPTVDISKKPDTLSVIKRRILILGISVIATLLLVYSSFKFIATDRDLVDTKANLQAALLENEKIKKDRDDMQQQLEKTTRDLDNAHQQTKVLEQTIDRLQSDPRHLLFRKELIGLANTMDNLLTALESMSIGKPQHPKIIEAKMTLRRMRDMLEAGKRPDRP